MARVLAVALTLLALLYAASSAWGLAHRGEPGMFYSDDGRVNVVEPGGPAARAGIEPGDRIVFAEMPAASRLLAIEQMNPAGDVLQFTIERRGQSHTESLQLIAPISFDFVSLIKRPIAALL